MNSSIIHMWKIVFFLTVSGVKYRKGWLTENVTLKTLFEQLN
jgi:hypothetical protein